MCICHCFCSYSQLIFWVKSSQQVQIMLHTLWHSTKHTHTHTFLLFCSTCSTLDLKGWWNRFTATLLTCQREHIWGPDCEGHWGQTGLRAGCSVIGCGEIRTETEDGHQPQQAPRRATIKPVEKQTINAWKSRPATHWTCQGLKKKSYFCLSVKLFCWKLHIDKETILQDYFICTHKPFFIYLPTIPFFDYELLDGFMLLTECRRRRACISACEFFSCL